MTFLTAAALISCSQSTVSNSSAITNPMEIDATEYSRIFNASITTLRSMGFGIEEENYRFGQVSTKPTTSPMILEVWKPTNTTLDQMAQSTLNNQRRIVRVSLEPGPVMREPASNSTLITKAPSAAQEKALADAKAAGTLTPAMPLSYKLRVEVIVEQQQAPTAYLNGSTNGDRMVSRLTAVPENWRDRGLERTFWQPIGRDAYLENRLLVAIIRKSGESPEVADNGDAEKTTSPTTQPVSPNAQPAGGTKGLEGY